MKRVIIILLVVLLAFQVSSAFAKREVNSSDYETAGTFLADIETGTKVTFDAILFSTHPYEDEDTFCMSFVLLPQTDIEYSPTLCIYAREEDLGGIHDTILKIHLKIGIIIHYTVPFGRSTVALNQSQALPVLGALLHGSCEPNHRFGQLLKAPPLHK